MFLRVPDVKLATQSRAPTDGGVYLTRTISIGAHFGGQPCHFKHAFIFFSQVLSWSRGVEDPLEQ
jgi:hypothetical protein